MVMSKEQDNQVRWQAIIEKMGSRHYMMFVQQMQIAGELEEIDCGYLSDASEGFPGLSPEEIVVCERVIVGEQKDARERALAADNREGVGKGDFASGEIRGYGYLSECNVAGEDMIEPLDMTDLNWTVARTTQLIAENWPKGTPRLKGYPDPEDKIIRRSNPGRRFRDGEESIELDPDIPF